MSKSRKKDQHEHKKILEEQETVNVEQETVDVKQETVDVEQETVDVEQDSQKEADVECNGIEDAEITKITNELKEEKDKFLRLAAEYDNYRKRTQKEREGIYSDVRAETVSQLLPVYDNLERALSHKTTDEAFYKGVEMIMSGFTEIMDKMGVKEIPAVGEVFDPQFHNAVLHVEDEDKGSNEIVEQLQKGFTMGDKVIRFSLVKVAN